MSFDAHKHLDGCIESIESFGGGIYQNRIEVEQASEIIEKQKPQTIVEVGRYYGGTLLTFGLLCAPDALIVSIDPTMKPGVPFVVDQLAATGRLPVLVCGLSGSVIACVHSLVEGVIDCLIIDGDHHAGHLTSDFKNYYPLVRPGGIVMAHDVVNRNVSSVGREWEVIRQRCEAEGSTTSIIQSNSPILCRDVSGPLGWGVIWKGE